MRSLGDEQRRTTPYHPQGNGVVEWLVRTVKESILAMIRGDTARWPDVVPEVLYFYNTTVHTRHGSTPFSLFFARPHTPLRGEDANAPLRFPSSRQMNDRLKWMTEVVFPAIESRSTAFAERLHANFLKRHYIIKKRRLPRGGACNEATDTPYLQSTSRVGRLPYCSSQNYGRCLHSQGHSK